MTRADHLFALSSDFCCLCSRRLQVRELMEFYSLADEEVHAAVYCPECREVHLALCRECSGRFTVAGGICGECAAREYRMTG